jgi:hypothetical protein
MPAPIASRSADRGQVHFSDYLRARPLENDPPRSIRARDLDNNFARLTVIAPKTDPPPYRVNYTERGTELLDISGLPPGAVARQFSVCEDGTPRQYWFITWDEKPELPEVSQ